MKKIIAAAVATAFVAPAFAADVSVGGYLEFAFTSTNDTNQVMTDSVNNESYFVIAVSEEVGNGITVGGDYSIAQGGGDYSGDSAFISGSFGKIEFGDTSGAIDAIDDKADVFKIHDNGNGITSQDAQFAWTLPTFVDGLSTVVAYGPEEGQTADASVFDVDQFNNDTGENGLAGASLYYKAMDNLSLGYGIENISNDGQDDERKLFNIVYSVAGVRLAYENSTVDNNTTGTVAGQEQTSVAATYTANDVTFKLGTNEIQDTDAGTTTQDITAFGVEYKIGALSFYAETAEDDKGDKDELTAVGMAYKF